MFSNLARIFTNMASTSTTARKHGGSRTVLTWEQKLTQLDPDVICHFVANANCKCAGNWMQKVRDLGQQALSIVSKLREERLSGL